MRGNRILQAKRRRLRAKLIVLEYLQFHPCLDCGETDVLVLEFDHRGKKKACISFLVRMGRCSALLREIEKCDVRCANCHRKRHLPAKYKTESIESLKAQLAALVPLKFGRPRKLTWEQVLQIRSRAENGESKTSIANGIGVSRGLVFQIVKGNYWKYPYDSEPSGLADSLDEGM